MKILSLAASMLLIPLVAFAYGAPPQDVVIYPNALSVQNGTLTLSEPHCPGGYTLVVVSSEGPLKCAPTKSLIDPER